MCLKITWENIYLCGKVLKIIKCRKQLQNNVWLKFTCNHGKGNEKEEWNTISRLLDWQKRKWSDNIKCC